MRHHVKEASFYGVDTWSVDLLLQLPKDGSGAGLRVNFVGTKEAVQWPAKKALEGLGSMSRAAHVGANP